MGNTFAEKIQAACLRFCFFSVVACIPSASLPSRLVASLPFFISPFRVLLFSTDYLIPLPAETNKTT